MVDELLRLQRLAGNAAVASLFEASARPSLNQVSVQRCRSRACQAGCAHEEQEALAGWTPVQAAPETATAGPATTTIEATEEELKPLCDFEALRKTIPADGDSDPAPDETNVVEDADVTWVDEVKSPALADWLLPQIDRPYAVGRFETSAKKWMKNCEAQARNKVKSIRKPEQKQVAEETLNKQLQLDQAEVAKVVTEFADKTATGRANYRKAFMRTMRCLLGPDPAVKNHFSSLEQVSPGLWLDAEAATRMRQVQDALKAQGHDLPSTDVGQGLRGHHLQNHQTGWWGHALGFSVDFFAYENPHIVDPRTSRLVEMLTGDADRMRFTDAKAKEMDYGARRSVIRDIGEKSAAGEDPTTDPAMARFLEQVDEQYLKMVEGSHKMQSDVTVLPAANRKELEQLKHDYVDLYEQTVGARGELAAQQKALDLAKKLARGKLAKAAVAAGAKKPTIGESDIEADADVVQAARQVTEAKLKLFLLQLRQTALKDELPKVFKPWLDRIKAEFLDLDGAAGKQGVVAAQLPDLKGWRFNEIEATLEKMAAREGQVPPDKWAIDPQLKGLRSGIAKDLAKVTGALSNQGAIAKKSSAEILKDVRTVRAFVWKRNDRPTMQSLYNGLSGELTYTLGVVQAVPDRYKKAGGDRYWLRPGYGFEEQVPVAQLLEKPGDRNARLRVGGYIRSDNDKAGFNQVFVKTMVRFGWEPGAAWLPGSVDTMHFDFVKGFDRVQIGGAESCGPHGKA